MASVAQLDSGREVALARLRRVENTAWRARCVAEAVYHEAIAAAWRNHSDKAWRAVQGAAVDRRRAVYAWRVARERRLVAEDGGPVA